jgi:hypothetical protein
LLSELPHTPRRNDLSSLLNTAGPFERTLSGAASTALTLIIATALVTAACGNDSSSPTSPTSTSTTTPTVAAPSITEDFTGMVTVGGSAFYSFTVGENGTVNVTYTAAGGSGVPGSVWLGLGLGAPSGEDCITTSNVNSPPTSTAQLTGTYAPGIYCVKVSDIGNLYAPATFSVSIAHP